MRNLSRQSLLSAYPMTAHQAENYFSEIPNTTDRSLSYSFRPGKERGKTQMKPPGPPGIICVFNPVNKPGEPFTRQLFHLSA
jgi:hypothetical protein